MSPVVISVAIVGVVLALGWAFITASPRVLARVLRAFATIALLVLAARIAMIGQVQFAILLAGLAAMTAGIIPSPFGSILGGVKATPTPGKRSTVRSAAFEMELDHDTGTLSGVVIAGRYEGRALAQLSVEELLALWLDLQDDGESRALLEAYLDRRAPTWRQDMNADRHARFTGPPSTGPMTDQEAYQILGLEPGANEPEIREAHRRLMMAVHPDRGGSTFLAARINEAKDILLTKHRSSPRR
jgi:hypothetical protein